jgi:hypothetical protein
VRKSTKGKTQSNSIKQIYRKKKNIKPAIINKMEHISGGKYNNGNQFIPKSM